MVFLGSNESRMIIKIKNKTVNCKSKLSNKQNDPIYDYNICFGQFRITYDQYYCMSQMLECERFVKKLFLVVYHYQDEGDIL